MVNNGVTPYEMLFEKAPSYGHMRTFGCFCYVRNPSKHRENFDSSAEKCIFVGYPLGQKGWKVYNLKTKEFLVSRDVVFYEDKFPYDGLVDSVNADSDSSISTFHHWPQS